MNIIRRISSRRNDKIQLFIGMIIAAMVPLSVFWLIPNALASQRAEVAEQISEDEQIVEEKFRSEYASLIAFCDTDSGEEPSGSLPVDARVLILRYGLEADFQVAVSTEMQPTGVDDINIVICLSRETTRPSTTCEDGTTPDFATLTAGYEQDSGVRAPHAGKAGEHPDLAGRVLARYYTEVRVYNVETGELVSRDGLWGSEALLCSEPPSIAPSEYLTGMLLLNEVRYYIDGERLEIGSFQDWLDVTLAK